MNVTGDRLYDGSGLSRLDRLTTDSLRHRWSGSPRVAEHPELRPVMTGLPVAGFTGSLTYRFDKGPPEAKGRVRAKTGTLTGVHGLAGIADDATGARMVFVVVADRVATAEEPRGTDADRPHRRRAGRVQVRGRFVAMSR